MKSIHSLIMIAVCMTVFTSMATTTAKMEQKQKTELVKDFKIQAYDVSVVNEFNVVSVYADANILKVESESVTFKVFGPDVGSFDSKQNFSIINYKEKLLENYNKDFIVLNLNENRIRHCC